MTDCLIIIPARYKSTRLPGKPLRKICGETMLKRVHDRCISTGLDTIVATDDSRIEKECIDNSIEVIMTSSNCLTGTDRVAEVLNDRRIRTYAGYINVQGDEPFVKPADILTIANVLSESYDRSSDEVLCGMCEITEKEQYYSPHVPKIIFDQDNSNLRYISRAPIPAVKKDFNWPIGNAWKQVCIYGFKAWHLEKFAKQKEKTTLEFVEDIEILRFLEMGIAVRMIMIEGSLLAVDTEEDLKRANDLTMKLNTLVKE